MLHTHLPAVWRWRHHRMWLLAAEAVASLAWILALTVSLLITLLSVAVVGNTALGFGLAWGIAISVLATLQVTVALWVETRYDPRNWRAYLLQPVCPALFWLASAVAALRSEVAGLITGPHEQRVVWDIPREQLEPPA